jgi:hypothetical protein
MVNRPSDGFERWTDARITGIGSARLAARWVIVATILSLLFVFVAAVVLQSGVFRGALVLVGLYGLLLLFLRTWFILATRTRRYLVSRPAWGDLTRLAIFFGVFLAIPLIGSVVGYVVLVLLAQLDRAGRALAVVAIPS